MGFVAGFVATIIINSWATVEQIFKKRPILASSFIRSVHRSDPNLQTHYFLSAHCYIQSHTLIHAHIIHMQTFLHSPCMCQCFQGLCIALRLSLSLHLEGPEGGYVKYSLSSPSAVLSVSTASISLKSPLHPTFCHSFSFYLLYIDIMYTLLYLWILVPSSAHPDTSSLHQFAGALESMQHCLSLFTVDFTNDSQQQLFSPSYWELFCVVLWARSCVKSCLPSSITSTISNSPRRFLPVAMDDLKTAWLKKN